MLLIRIFTNRLTYLSVSFILFLSSIPMVSWGTTKGNTLIWMAGLLMLICGALIPPVQRLVYGPPPQKK